jgi:hypothetical protein
MLLLYLTLQQVDVHKMPCPFADTLLNLIDAGSQVNKAHCCVDHVVGAFNVLPYAKSVITP